MKKNELELAAEMLELASDTFSNHGCNDYYLPEKWSQDECDEFMLAMETWNRSPENYSPGCRVTDDWMVMSYLAAKVKQLASELP